MDGIKYYALDENEEVPYEFVVIRNVNGEPEFYASFVNTNSLAYGNGVLLKLHERNDELRAENAKLRERLKARELKVVLQESDLDEIVRIACDMYFVISTLEVANDEAVVSKDGVMLDMEYFRKELRELGVEVEESDVSAGLRVEDAKRTQ